MKKIAVLLSGKGTTFAHIVKVLHLKACEVVLVLSDKPQAQGLILAQAEGIAHAIIEPKHFESREAYDEAVVATIMRHGAELSVLAGFMRILTPVFTDQIKAINLHPSLLPKHKGLRAIERSYEDEDLEGGVSVHYVSSELDGGEIIVQKRLIKEDMDLEQYTTAIKVLEKEAVIEAILSVCND